MQVLERMFGGFGSIAEREAEIARRNGAFEKYKELILDLPLQEDPPPSQLLLERGEWREFKDAKFVNCTFIFQSKP